MHGRARDPPDSSAECGPEAERSGPRSATRRAPVPELLAIVLPVFEKFPLSVLETDTSMLIFLIDGARLATRLARTSEGPEGERHLVLLPTFPFSGLCGGGCTYSSWCIGGAIPLQRSMLPPTPTGLRSFSNLSLTIVLWFATMFVVCRLMECRRALSGPAFHGASTQMVAGYVAEP